MKPFNKQIQTAQPLNVSSNGPASPVKFMYMYSIAANISGTPNGIIKLQASNDPATDETPPSGVPFPTPTNWADIERSTFTVTTSGTTMWNVYDVAYNYVRVVYTDSSSGASTATMNVIINGKGV